MSAYMVDAATIDAIVSGARQFGGQSGFSFYRFFPGVQPNAGGSYHKFSRYASDDDAPETFNPNTLGRELWTENLRSVHHRYPDTVDNPSDTPGTIGFSELDVVRYEYGPGSRVVDVDPLGVIGAIRGYSYQACEHPDWHHSIAKAAVESIRDSVLYHLIERTGANAWTVDEVDEVEGDTVINGGDDGSWSIRFTPGRSPGVSLLEMMQRGR